MGCFSCFRSGREKGSSGGNGGGRAAASSSAVADSSVREEGTGSSVEMTSAGNDKDRGKGKEKVLSVPNKIPPQAFSLHELVAATMNFRDDCFIGEGGFGRVYKGRLDGTGQVVAVKKLNKDGKQGNREFEVEVQILSLLHHENLAELVGYCAHGDQRLLVYEYMALGSLEDHLHNLRPDKEPLDWNTRMKIALGAAKGLEYLHNRDGTVIYRDMKSSNILLGEGFHPKLSDFGLAKLFNPVGGKSHVTTRVMGTYGYCAPEYAMTGQLTIKSDIYSFGVVLLELITGRRAIDGTRPRGERNLVAWARTLFKDKRNFRRMADPRLAGRYPWSGLCQVMAVARLCVWSQAAYRPLIAEIVVSLTYLAGQTYDPNATSTSKKAGGGDQVSGVVDSVTALSKSDDSGSCSQKSRNKDREASPRIMNKDREASPRIRYKDRKDSPGIMNKDPEASPRIMNKDRKDSLRITNKDLNREQMVAEAKKWGEGWREKRRAAGSQGSLDSPSGSGDS